MKSTWQWNRLILKELHQWNCPVVRGNRSDGFWSVMEKGIFWGWQGQGKVCVQTHTCMTGTMAMHIIPPTHPKEGKDTTHLHFEKLLSPMSKLFQKLPSLSRKTRMSFMSQLKCFTPHQKLICFYLANSGANTFEPLKLIQTIQRLIWNLWDPSYPSYPQPCSRLATPR